MLYAIGTSDGQVYTLTFDASANAVGKFVLNATGSAKKVVLA